ncbi:hypothetical protein [Streptomyces antarcticus]|uniref:hypothetical protein n=1 Tax=Streptomyces antarcticus TaxID=2996458 RepID=UPI00227041D1|nr:MULTISPECIES: hypothetical protein [unclassified Streptomyces]MCY0940695.1 hypothetical protein [Streptomyces sp. H34-AA3]MCZ4082037.1 hypothetical protein [Streptomyces sp. H34-S5]
MSHSTLLKATVGAKIRLTTWSDTTITRIRQRHANLDRGQTAFEYLGIILVVIVIIGAVVGSGVGSEITKRIKQAVTDIKAG